MYFPSHKDVDDFAAAGTAFLMGAGRHSGGSPENVIGGQLWPVSADEERGRSGGTGTSVDAPFIAVIGAVIAALPVSRFGLAVTPGPGMGFAGRCCSRTGFHGFEQTGDGFGSGVGDVVEVS